MPKSFHRWLAVALLALTVPLQGMASVAAGQCMAFGHHQDGGSQHEHAQDGSDSPDHVTHSHADDSSATKGDENGKSAQCGPCAACCASASIAGPAGLSIAPAPSNAKHLLSQLPLPGFQPRGLDRPPLAL